MVDHYAEGARNGAIFLMHPGTYKYLDDIINRVSGMGFEFRLLADIINQDITDQ